MAAHCRPQTISRRHPPRIGRIAGRRRTAVEQPETRRHIDRAGSGARPSENAGGGSHFQPDLPRHRALGRNRANRRQRNPARPLGRKRRIRHYRPAAGRRAVAGRGTAGGRQHRRNADPLHAAFRTAGNPHHAGRRRRYRIRPAVAASAGRNLGRRRMGARYRAGRYRNGGGAAEIRRATPAVPPVPRNPAARFRTGNAGIRLHLLARQSQRYAADAGR